MRFKKGRAVAFLGGSNHFWISCFVFDFQTGVHRLTSRSSRQPYAPQLVVHVLRTLLHNQLLHYGLRLNSGVMQNQSHRAVTELRIMVRRIVAVLLTNFFVGCATYKVYPDGELKSAPDAKDVSIKKVNEWPEGLHCFEPLFYVLSLGIIPTHCVNTYGVEVENSGLGTVKVTSMQGWVTLLMIPFPAWQFGYGNEADVLDNVKDIVVSKK